MIQVVVRDDGWEDHLHPTLIEHVVNLAHEHKLSVSRVIEAAIVTYLNRAHAANITDRSRAAAQWLERGDDLLLLERQERFQEHQNCVCKCGQPLWKHQEYHWTLAAKTYTQANQLKGHIFEEGHCLRD